MFKRIAGYFDQLVNAERSGSAQKADGFLLAAETGDLTTLKNYFSEGLSAKGDLSRHGIHAAASTGQTATVDFLIEKGVPATGKVSGQTPAAAARKAGHDDLAQKLDALASAQTATAKPPKP